MGSVAKRYPAGVVRVSNTACRTSKSSVAILGTDPVKAESIFPFQSVHVTLVDKVVTTTTINH